MTVVVLRPDAVLLPLCAGSHPETRCTCGGTYLAYLAGGYRHVAACDNCPTEGPCPGPHTACHSPEPVRCPHCERRPVELGQRCADPRVDGCCTCCWKEPARAAAH